MVMSHLSEPVARVSLSLPPKLLARFDSVSQESGFKDRSKALQATMRSFITEEEQAHVKAGTITGALLVIYNHEIRGIDARLTDLEHDNREIIASSTHMHLGVSHCLKVLVVRGRMEKVSTLEKKLRHLKGIMQLKLSLLKTEAD
jgi:CopG family transcriptional regulator, nickel-responsive regulator